MPVPHLLAGETRKPCAWSQPQCPRMQTRSAPAPFSMSGAGIHKDSHASLKLDRHWIFKQVVCGTSVTHTHAWLWYVFGVIVL